MYDSHVITFRQTIHEALGLISQTVGGVGIGQSVWLRGLLDAENQRFLATDEGIQCLPG